MEDPQEYVRQKAHESGYPERSTVDPEELQLQWLVDQRELTDTMAGQVRQLRAESGGVVGELLLKLGLFSEARFSDLMTKYSGLPSWSSSDAVYTSVIPENVSGTFFRKHGLVPVERTEGYVVAACWNPVAIFPVRALEFALGCAVHRVIATRTDISLLLDRLYPKDIEVEVSEDPTGIFGQEEIDRLKDLASDAPAIRLVQRLIDQAVESKASDLHLESTEESLIVRLRLDGLLRESARYPKSVADTVVSRIKVMAGLDIAERRLPQDGRIHVTVQGKDIDFRVATSPVLHGETVVLRILDRHDVQLDFAALGFDEGLIEILRAALFRPHGIVLVTGPTGSGKTTTLYAALKEINHPSRKILTVEDPVEYVLEGVNQVNIRPQIGLTFAQALRSFLRQDPDVLMVGEIRDRETAETAVQAALTGHMLISTLHTNSAAAAITRLMDMGIEDFLLTSTLQLVIGQRLVRRLCVSCREPYLPEPSMLHKCGVSRRSGDRWYRPRGCRDCHQTGYRGRTALIEALRMTDEVRTAVLRHADANQIEQIAATQGLRTLFYHGMERVDEGLTSIEEVVRVTSLN